MEQCILESSKRDVAPSIVTSISTREHWIGCFGIIPTKPGFRTWTTYISWTCSPSEAHWSSTRFRTLLRVASITITRFLELDDQMNHPSEGKIWFEAVRLYFYLVVKCEPIASYTGRRSWMAATTTLDTSNVSFEVEKASRMTLLSMCGCGFRKPQKVTVLSPS